MLGATRCCLHADVGRNSSKSRNAFVATSQNVTDATAHSVTPWQRYAEVSHQPIPTNGTGPDSSLTMSTSASKPMPATLDTATPVLASYQLTTNLEVGCEDAKTGEAVSSPHPASILGQSSSHSASNLEESFPHPASNLREKSSHPAINLEEASSHAASSLGEASCHSAIHLQEDSAHPAFSAHIAQASQPEPAQLVASTTTADPPVVNQLCYAQKQLSTDIDAGLGTAAGAQSNSSQHLAGASEDEADAQAPPVLVPSTATFEPVTVSQPILEDHAVLSTPLLTDPAQEAENLDEDMQETPLLDGIRQRQEAFKAHVQARLLAPSQPWWQRFLANYQVRKLTILENQCCHCLAAVLSQLSGTQAYHSGEQCCCLAAMQFLSNKRVAPCSGLSGMPQLIILGKECCHCLAAM